MTTAPTKLLHPLDTFACETRVPVRKFLTIAFKLSVVALLTIGLACGFAFAVLAGEPVAFFVAIAASVFVAVFAYELLTGRRVARPQNGNHLRQHHSGESDWSQRSDRYFNPDNHHNPNR